MASRKQTDKERIQSFKWAGQRERDPAYVSYAQYNDLPATSFDFGDEGFAGSCNYGGEILQLSARTDSNDLVFARGRFQPTLYATLARAQQEFGGECTFGLKLKETSKGYHPRNLFEERDSGSSFYLGVLLDRGCFNYRWPFHEYSLCLNENPDMDREKSMWEKIRWKCNRLKLKGKIPKSFSEIEFLRLVDEIYKKWEEELEEKWNEESARMDPNVEKIRTKREMDFLKRVEPLIISLAIDANGKLQFNQNIKPASNGWVPPYGAFRGRYNKRTGSRDSDIGNEGAPNRKSKREIGTCASFSFVKAGTVYQVLRLEQSGWSDETQSVYVFSDETQVALTVGGPVRFDASDGTEVPSYTENSAANFEEVSQNCQTSTWNDGSCKTARVSPSHALYTLEARIYQLMDCTGHENESDHERAGPDQCYMPLDLEHTAGQGLYEALAKLPSRMGPRAWRSTTFIAALRLREKNTEMSGEHKWQVPDPRTIYEYVCSNEGAGDATALMWERIYFRRSILRQPFSRISDVHLIGRALEKILQVDMVPLKCHANCKHRTGAHPATLISNLFVSPAVDYESLFWKLRFLLKILTFLESEVLAKEGHKCLQHSLETKEMLELREFELDQRETVRFTVTKQIKRIRMATRRIVAFLADAIRDLESLVKHGLDLPNILDPSHRYYLWISLWYTIRNAPGLVQTSPSPLKDLIPEYDFGKPDLRGLPRWQNESGFPRPRDKSSANKYEEKLVLLRWYHLGSILGLCQQCILPPTWERFFKQKVLHLRSAALVFSAAKYSSRQPYCASDEIFDRLAFLGLELGLESISPSTSSVASLSMDRIKNRDYTRTINRGRLTIDEYEDIDGPWEVHALCHHSRLKVFSLELDSITDRRTMAPHNNDVESFKLKLTQFMNSEGLLVPCWERSQLSARSAWLHSEASGVLASTLLDLFSNKPRVLRDAMGFDDRLPSTIPAKYDVEHTEGIIWSKTSNLPEKFQFQSLRYHQAGASPTVSAEPCTQGAIEWMETWRIPRQYHPDNFITSLEDTPEKYNSSAIQNVIIPIPLIRFLGPFFQAGLGLSSLIGLKKADRCHVYIADLIDGVEKPVVTGTKYRGEEFPSDWVPPSDEYRRPSRKNDEDFEPGQLLERLYDNLVDQGIQHRTLLITAHHPSKHLLALLVYVLCTRSASCMSNHMLRISRFSLKNDDWYARITILTWSPHIRQGSSYGGRKGLSQNGKEDNADEYSDLSNAGCISLPFQFEPLLDGSDNDTIERPDLTVSVDGNIASAPGDQERGLPSFDYRRKMFRDQINEREDLSIEQDTLLHCQFELQSSSLMMMTNSFGDFSKTCIVSEYIDESILRDVSEEIRKVRLRFVHQPQTARCLAYLLILRRIIKRVVTQYRDARDAISHMTSNSDQYHLGNRKWTGDEAEIHRYEFRLWKLQSLYQLQASLEDSIASIQDAKEQLCAQIRDGPGTRRDCLEHECQEAVVLFESSFADMTGMKAGLDGVIENFVRYKDSVEVLMTLRDSRTSLEQNRSIERLTYLTIVYLPIGLMAAIFAIPKEQDVVPETMGSRNFGVYIVITAVATFMFAYCVKSILGTISSVVTVIMRYIWHSLPKCIRSGLIKADEAFRAWYDERKTRYEERRRNWEIESGLIRQKHRTPYASKR